MFGIGYQEMFIIGLAALLIFGPGRLPEMMGQIGRWVRDFRRMSADLTSEFQDAMAEVDDVKRSVEREFGSMRDEVAGVSSSVKKDLKGSAKAGTRASGTKAPGTKTGTARAIGAKSTAGSARPAAARSTATAGSRAAAGSRALATNSLPVATKADPLADVSFLDDDIPAAQNGHSATGSTGNGAGEVDDALVRVRQRRAAAGYGRRA